MENFRLNLSFIEAIELKYALLNIIAKKTEQAKDWERYPNIRRIYLQEARRLANIVIQINQLIK